MRPHETVVVETHPRDPSLIGVDQAAEERQARTAASQSNRLHATRDVLVAAQGLMRAEYAREGWGDLVPDLMDTAQVHSSRQQAYVDTVEIALAGLSVSRLRAANNRAAEHVLTFAEAHQFGSDPDLSLEQYHHQLALAAIRGYRASLVGRYPDDLAAHTPESRPLPPGDLGWRTVTDLDGITRLHKFPVAVTRHFVAQLQHALGPSDPSEQLRLIADDLERGAS